METFGASTINPATIPSLLESPLVVTIPQTNSTATDWLYEYDVGPRDVDREGMSCNDDVSLDVDHKSIG